MPGVLEMSWAHVAAVEVLLRRTTQASKRGPVSAHGAAASRAHTRGVLGCTGLFLENVTFASVSFDEDA